MLYTIKDLEELFSSLNKNCRVFKDDGSLTKQGRIGYEIAKKGNITMVGFVRNNRFNLYSAPQRINLEK